MGAQAQETGGGEGRGGKGREAHGSVFLFTVHGSRFAVHGSRFAVHGSQFTVHGSRFAVHGSRFTIHLNITRKCYGRFFYCFVVLLKSIHIPYEHMCYI